MREDYHDGTPSNAQSQPSRSSSASNENEVGDRVITTTVEDVRLYRRSLGEILGENGWVLFIVFAFLAMAIYGLVVTILK